MWAFKKHPTKQPWRRKFPQSGFPGLLASSLLFFFSCVTSPWAQKTGKKRGGRTKEEKLSCASFRRRELVLSLFSSASLHFYSIAAAFMGHSGISGKNKTGHHRSSLSFLPLFPCAYSSVQRRIPPPALSPSSSLIPPPSVSHSRLARHIRRGKDDSAVQQRRRRCGRGGGCQAYSGARICDAIRRRSTCPPRGP